MSNIAFARTITIVQHRSVLPSVMELPSSWRCRRRACDSLECGGALQLHCARKWKSHRRIGAKITTLAPKKKRISRVRSTVCDGVSVCVQVQLRKTSGALDIATLHWRLPLRHRIHRLWRVQDIIMLFSVSHRAWADLPKWLCSYMRSVHEP